MKNKSYYVIAEIANFIMITLLYVTVSEIWNMLYKTPLNHTLPAGCVIMLLFSLLLRTLFGRINSFLNNIFVYAFLHIIPLLALIFVPIDPINKLILFFMYAVIFITDMRNYLVSNGDGFAYVSVILVLLPAFAYLFADIFDIKLLMTYFFIIGILYVLLYYIRLFFEDAYLLSIERKNNEKMPLEDMLKNDSKLAIPFIAISFVIMAVARLDALDRAALFLYLKFAEGARFVLVKVLWFIGWVFDHLFQGEPIDMPLAEAIEEGEEAAGNVVFTWISNILFVGLALIVLFVIVKIIISIFKSISVRKEVTTTTFEDEGMIEIREKIVRKKGDKKDKLTKIRRIYKKTIERYMKKGYELKEYQTPKERVGDIKKFMNEDISALNAMYEKERYGQFND